MLTSQQRSKFREPDVLAEFFEQWPLKHALRRYLLGVEQARKNLEGLVMLPKKASPGQLEAVTQSSNIPGFNLRLNAAGATGRLSG